jgi:NitT/TauT family transport system substrate-binding protein
MGRFIVALFALFGLGTITCAETLKVAIGQKGAWETTIADWGQRQGFFKQEGLELEILFTSGGGETQQAVISNGVDIGVGVGIIGVIGASAKGAPIKIISASFTGCPDLFWYVRNDSTVKTFKDAAGKKIAFSTVGASTQLIAQKLVEQAGVKSELIATGGVPATLTSVMSGQIDIGWSFPPFGFAQLDRGEIRIVGRGIEIPDFANQTVRVLVANASVMEKRRDAVVRFMRAYKKTLEWMYAEPDVLAWYAGDNNATLAHAKRAVEQFEPREATRLGPVHGLEISMRQAIEFKRIEKPMDAREVARMLDIVNPN